MLRVSFGYIRADSSFIPHTSDSNNLGGSGNYWGNSYFAYARVKILACWC